MQHLGNNQPFQEAAADTAMFVLFQDGDEPVRSG